MQSKILIVGHHYESVQSVKEHLSLNKLYQIVEADDQAQAIRRLSQKNINLVIFDLDVFTAEKVKLATQIRKMGHTAPVLMLAKAVKNSSLEEVKKLSKTVVLEKPYEHKELFGITSKLLNGQDVIQKIHKRFYTNQATTIELMGNSSQKFTGQMLNLSKGGAYIEIPDLNQKIEGLVKMSVPLQQLEKNYEVNARIVWSSIQSIWGKGMAVGIEFIQARDVYRSLLNNL